MDDLSAVVAAWDAARVAEQGWYDPDQIPLPVAQRGTVLLTGATEGQLCATEARLGMRLPPSYRAFLAISNGAYADAIGLGIRHFLDEDLATIEPAMWPCERIDWAGNVDRRLVDMWAIDAAGGVTDPDVHPGYRTLVPESQYLDHSADQDPGHSKTAHLRHSLAVSRNVDGYAVFLNPLVADAAGEWEVLDFGTKTVGGTRHASFRDFLAERAAADESPGVADDEAPAALVALDASAPPADRLRAIGKLMLRARRSDDLIEPIVEIALDERLEPQERSTAIHWMRSVDDPRIVDAVVRLADAGGFDRELLPVASSLSDPRAGEVMRRLLRKPETEGRIGFVYRDLHGALLDTYLETGRPDLLKQALQVGDQRALEPALAVMRDGGDSSSELAAHLYRVDVSAHFAELAEIAMRPGAPHQRIGIRMAEAGAGAAAVPVLARSLEDRNPTVDFCDHLADIATPEALAALAAATRHQSALVRSHALIVMARIGEDVVAPASEAIADPATTIHAIDALEIAGTAAARDALLATRDSGAVSALRALARLGDERILDSCLDMLVSGDAGQAVEALRDLRHPSSVRALAAVVTGTRSGDTLTVACHALAMIGGPEAAAALRGVETHDAHLRRLVDRWLHQLDSR